MQSSRMLTSTSTGPQQYLHVGPITSDMMTNLSPHDAALYSSMEASRPIAGVGHHYALFESNDNSVDAAALDSDPLTAAAAFVPLSLPSYESRRVTMKESVDR
jgi:hypothetical protein